MAVRMLFVQKDCAIMAACVYLFITDLNASVLLDFLVKDVRLTLMNAQVSLAITEELARIHHKDIDVSAHQVLLAFSAMRKIVTVINRLVQSARCAEMSQESAISAVSVEPDIKVSFYIGSFFKCVILIPAN